MLEDKLNEPPVHLHVLAIEKEDGCRNEGDVKVRRVHWDGIYIHNVDVSHLGDSYLILGKLRTC